MKRSDAQIHIRVPADVHAWLDAQRSHYGSSHASEIVRAVRERMDRLEHEKLGKAAPERINSAPMG